MPFPRYLLSLALALALCALGCACAATTYYLAPNGNDRWSGTLAAPNRARTDGPFATLERARNAIRTLKTAGGLPAGGVVVELRAGTYAPAHPFALDARDGGTAAAPIVYRARKGEAVRVIGGAAVTAWGPVTDAKILARLDPAARAHVRVADLHALGVTDCGIPTGGWGQWEQANRLELFFQDRPMTMARWPNEGFTKIADVQGATPIGMNGEHGCKEGVLVYDGDRPARWAEEKDIWVDGYWFWDWAEQRQQVARVDAAKHQLILQPPHHDFGYRKGQWFYAYNVLAELDQPGEWYIDRAAGLLYFWPPTPLDTGRAVVSVQPSIVTMKDTAYVTLRGLTLEAARNAAVTIDGGTGCRVVACTIRNCGGWAVTVTGGTAHAVVGCDISETGDGGIALTGGDRRTLTAAGLRAENNHIHHYSRWNRVYQPGIALNGVGNIAAHNLIDNAPHEGMSFSGNNHVIEYNEIHSVCYESNDAGAIYAGRDWTMRGTVVRYNYLHDLSGYQGRGCVGVYYDDQLSGNQAIGNLFYKVAMAVQIGGGRDVTVTNNVMVDCPQAFLLDARGLGWAAGSYGLGTLKAGLNAVPYRDAPWKDQYPALVGVLTDEPMAPKGTVVTRNILVNSPFGSFEAKAKAYMTVGDNPITGDPHFVDAAHGNFQLRDDAPAFKLGFQRIPVDKIGLYRDDDRASWPVTHTVRPVDAPAPKVGDVRPTFTVPRLAVTPADWGTDTVVPGGSILLAQNIDGSPLAPHSVAWLACDATGLRVAIVNDVNPAKPLHTGAHWGADDAVEIALRTPAGKADAPILVLRGFTNGKWESSDEAGAPAAAVQRAAQGVVYTAAVLDKSHWRAEWRIPYAALGLTPSAKTRCDCNITIRKTAGDQWLMWHGTGGNSWVVGNAGVIEIAKF